MMDEGTAGRRPTTNEPAAGSHCWVELLGTARLLAGEREVMLPVTDGMTLADLVEALGERLPELVGPVLDLARRTPADGYIVNRNGRDFLTDSAAPIRPGDRLLLLASVAGGR